MIGRLVILFAILALLVLSVGSYLSPDDLAGCDLSTPGGSEVCAPADAVVVVSGGDTFARTAEAIKLFKSGWAPYIVFSGAAADKDGPSNAQVMFEHALRSGVPEEFAIIEGESETTKQNAEQVKNQLQSRDIDNIILVTSGYHMRRASLEFSRQFGEVKIRSHPVASDSQWSSAWWLTPWGWWTAGGELVKIALFHVGGSR